MTGNLLLTDDGTGGSAEPLVVPPRIAPFTARDRCDRCGAQAYVGVLLSEDNEAALLFCGHHARSTLPALLALNPFEIRDDIALLSNEDKLRGSAH